MKRALPAALALLLLAAAGYFLFFRDKGGAKTAAQPDAAPTNASQRLHPSRDDAPTPLPPQQQFRYDDDPQGSLRLEGQVLGPDGAGVGGAVVTLSSNPPRTATSEDDGSFFFDKLIPKTYALTARAGDLAGGPVSRELTATSDPVIIRMKKGGTVTVTVVAASSGDPIAGAEVELRAGAEQTGSTGSDGVARFRGVGPGWMVVAAHASGYGTKRVPLVMPASGGADLTAELDLSPGVTIAGRVLDESGSPIAGAMVVAAPTGQMMPLVDGRHDGAYSGADGRFRLEHVATGKLEVSAYHKDYASASSEAMDVNRDIDDVELRMPAGGSVAGRVIDAGRQPVPFAQILVRPSGGAGRGWGGGGRGGRADEDGRFEIKGLPRATLELMAASDEATSEVTRVELGDRARAEGLEVVLSVTGTISGVVVDGGGDPVPEVQVSLMPDWSKGADASRFGLRSFQSTTTGGGGRFTFKGLDEGVFLLRATRDASNPMVYQLQGTRAKTGQSDVELTLLEDGGVKGRVVSERGEAVGVFSVTVGWPPGHPVSDERGEFDLAGIPPGTYDLKIRGADFAEKTVADVEVKPGETRDVGTIEVALGRTFLGRVLDPGGSPVSGAVVVVGRQVVGSGQSVTMSSDESLDETMRIRRAHTGDDGRFRIRGLADDELVAVAEHPDAGRSLPVTVPKGPARVERDIRLAPVGSVVGSVTKGGEPVPAVAVIAASVENRSQMSVSRTDDKGKFRIERLAAGDYNVSAMLSSGMSASGVSQRATVSGGHETRVDLVVEVGDVTLVVDVEPEPGAKVDSAQLFLFRGEANPKNGKEVNDAFLGAQASGSAMKFASPGTETRFAEQPPGPRTLCAIPITGDMSDPKFLQRLQEEALHLEVTCAPLEIAPSPAEQRFKLVVPEMKPLPEPS